MLSMLWAVSLVDTSQPSGYAKVLNRSATQERQTGAIMAQEEDPNEGKILASFLHTSICHSLSTRLPPGIHLFTNFAKAPSLLFHPWAGPQNVIRYHYF